MATIHYQFADGHYEDIECTEDFKEQFEFLQVREQALRWKEMKQKQRAGLRAVSDLSLDKFHEDGYDVPSKNTDPFQRLLRKEDQREHYRKILALLTIKQRQAYILHYIKGYKKVEIAALAEY